MGVWGHELRRIPTWPACAVLLVALACGPRRTRAPAAITGDEITLYRDRAVIRKRLEVNVPDADQAIVTLMVPAGVEVDDVVVLDRGELTVAQALAPRSSIEPVWKRDPRTSGEDDGDHDETDAGREAGALTQARARTSPRVRRSCGSWSRRRRPDAMA